MMSQSRWDATGTYLIWTSHRKGVCCRVDTASDTGVAWASTQQQRGFQPDAQEQPNWQPSHFSKLTLETSTNWQGTTDGRYLCVIDDHQAHYRQRGRVLAGQVTILEPYGGSVLHRLQLDEGVGPVNWSRQQYLCLLEQHGVVNAAGEACASMLDPADVLESSLCHVWHNRTLIKAHLATALETECPRIGSTGPPYRISPCGNFVIGSQLRPNASSVLPLQVWHLGPEPISQQSVQRTGTDAEGFLVQADMRTLAWHPSQQSCIFAVSDVEGGVHLIDAKAGREIISWTQAELRGNSPRDPLPEEISQLYEVFHKSLPAAVLAWSHDRCKLAVFSDGTCAMLTFA